MKKIILILFLLVSCDVNEEIGINLSTNKSMYAPGENVLLTLEIENPNEEIDLFINIDAYNVTEKISSTTNEVEINAKCTIDMTLPISLPSDDYKGYLLIVDLKDERGELYKSETIAVDVSSSWEVFPRYGYMVDYRELPDSTMTSRMNFLKRLHINGLQFYDWQYKHHEPLSLNDDIMNESWVNIANEEVYLSTVRYYLDLSKEFNITTMNYNLMFGAYEDYNDDGLQDSLGLYKTNNEQDYHELPSTWATQKLMIMDPSNIEWQKHIIDKENEVFDYLNFDGWHIDQLGNRGILYNTKGEPIVLEDTYNQFIEATGQKLDKDIVFNFVDGYGISKVGDNEELSFVYNEVWKEDEYSNLKQIIDSNNNYSNKKTVLAAYMNYDLADDLGEFNLPGVLLTDAVIFASGGSHIELGDLGMLGKEYFPNNNLKLTEELTTKLIDYYDFLVAYQNVLRDNTVDSNKTVEISDYKLSNNGMYDAVWYFTKSTEKYELIHFINLLGNDFYWRDTHGSKNEPEKVSFEIKFYSEENISKIYLASPDLEIAPNELDFTKHTIGDTYYEFTIPSLEYWDMIILEKIVGK